MVVTIHGIRGFLMRKANEEVCAWSPTSYPPYDPFRIA